ncbi:hypothetical protein [Microbispora sp. H11081]|uniref:hypothetical protein n=1 Tax=Microbispora sp. H11081 TaxID=2729107 RepID=UPI001475898D|nr:hypothetical protein [Microbispora sp. H11081]
MTAAAPGRGPGEPGRQDPLAPPDPTGLEAWIRQVLGLAGARASSFAPPLPPAPAAGRGHGEEEADDPGAAE